MSKKANLFLSEEDLRNLDLYEYHGGEYSYIDNFLNPFWYKVAYAFPNWFAPNLITLTGLIVNIIAALLVAVYDPMLEGTAPGWVYINAAICLQIYATLDAADGKQARRLNASSPLGQIFDHGCDAINLIFIIICTCSGIGLGIGHATAIAVIFMCGCFAFAQLLEYQTNILVAGSKVFGVTEAMLIVSMTLIITGLFGDDIYNIDVVTLLPFLKSYIAHCPLKYFVFIITVSAIVLTCLAFMIQGYIKECPIPIEKRGNKNVQRIDYLKRLTPVLVIGFCGYRLILSDIMKESPLYIILLIGLSFAFLSIRINISHLCRRRLSHKFAGMYPVVVIYLNSVLKLFPNRILIPFCFVFFMSMFIVFLYDTIIQIKEHLHIRVFHIQKKD